MTEAQWLKCKVPARLLNRRRSVSERKRLLFLATRYRQDWDLLGKDARLFVELMERHADGAVSKREYNRAIEAAEMITDDAFEAAIYDDFEEEDPALADRLRDIVGNPFRPVTVDTQWRTSDVLALTRGIYDDRAFDRLPILADALMDAGCANEDILAHCRSDGPHVRGCWVVDLILDLK